MTSSNFKKVDLLRKRRESNFLQDPFFIETRKYIKKGIYIGLSIISVSLLIGIIFIVRSNIIQRKKAEIKPLVDEHDALQIKLDKESKQLKLVVAFNKNLKNSIVNISSSTALLSEISSKIPKSIQLINLNSSNSLLTLKSQIPENKTFNLINGFLLSLDNSEFINFSDIDLGDIESDKEDENNKYYLVDITTKITTDFEDVNQKYLKILGSEGLSNRIDILKSFDE